MNAQNDLLLLGELVEDHAQDLTEKERDAFLDMLALITDGQRASLTRKERMWAQSVHDRVVPKYENLVSAGAVPRGREIEIPEVLRNLPKKPPRRSA